MAPHSRRWGEERKAEFLFFFTLFHHHSKSSCGFPTQHGLCVFSSPFYQYFFCASHSSVPFVSLGLCSLTPHHFTRCYDKPWLVNSKAGTPLRGCDNADLHLPASEVEYGSCGQKEGLGFLSPACYPSSV
uniref:Uncharacterized protein n=1 Tax=Laticauda laticaudata TaxID=8630 RepID=A0A8C5S1E9_LATLA